MKSTDLNPTSLDLSSLDLSSLDLSSLDLSSFFFLFIHHHSLSTRSFQL